VATYNIVAKPAQALSGLTTSTLIGAIRLDWNSTFDPELWQTEVWMSNTNDRNDAILYATVETGNTFNVNTSESDPVLTKYFWIRAVNQFGTVGPFYPEQATGEPFVSSWFSSGDFSYRDKGDTGPDFNFADVTSTDAIGGLALVGTSNGSMFDGGIDSFCKQHFTNDEATFSGNQIDSIEVQINWKTSHTPDGGTWSEVYAYWEDNFFYADDMDNGADISQNPVLITPTTSYANQTVLITNRGGNPLTFADVTSPNLGIAFRNNAMEAVGQTLSFDLIRFRVNSSYPGGIAGTASKTVKQYHCDTYSLSPSTLSAWASASFESTPTGSTGIASTYLLTAGNFGQNAISDIVPYWPGTDMTPVWGSYTTGAKSEYYNSNTAIKNTVYESGSPITFNPPYTEQPAPIGIPTWELAAYEPNSTYGVYNMVGCTDHVGVPKPISAINYSFGLEIDIQNLLYGLGGQCSAFIKVVVRQMEETSPDVWEPGIALKEQEFHPFRWNYGGTLNKFQSITSWSDSYDAPSTIPANTRTRIEVWLKKYRYDVSATFNLYWTKLHIMSDREM
jgi:hypothetical protein